MKKILLIILAIGFCNLSFGQGNLRRFEQKVYLFGLDNSHILNTNDTSLSNSKIKIIKEFKSKLDSIISKETELSKLMGKVSFSMTANNNQTKKLFQMVGGFSASKDNFPEEINFSANMNLQLDDDKIYEGLSNFSLSYDRFILDKNNKSITKEVSFEGFAFANRISNKFMDVKYRYEMGGGLIMAHWERKLSQKNKEERNAYTLSKYEIEVKEKLNISEGLNGKYQVQMSNSDSIKVSRALERLRDSYTRKYSRLRAGLLLGAFLEIENMEKSDSVVIDEQTGAQRLENLSVPRGKFRWEIRPTLQLTILDKFTITSKPYFKLPMWYEWHADYGDMKRMDYRIDIFNEIMVDMGKQFTAGVTHNYFYDNVPAQRKYSLDNGAYRYMRTASDSHLIAFKVTYKL